MMKNPPEISVVIPVFNRKRLLLRAIRSVLYQTFTDFEIIVVDDGSEEEISPLLEALGLENLSYHKLPHQNANLARNYGTNLAKGKYLAMLDSDDEWLKHHLESNLKIMHKHPCDGIYSSVVARSAEGSRIFQVRPLYEDEQMVNYLLSTNIGAQTSTLFMKTKAARLVRWDETLFRHQDYDFVVRFDKNFRWFVNLDATAIYHSEPNPGRTVDFGSCIRFIEQNKPDILPEVYLAYHNRMLKYAIALKSERAIINHYFRNSQPLQP